MTRPRPGPARDPWWRSYFDDAFYSLHEPLFTEADSRREVAVILEMLGLPASARVLDVPCGWGRHTRLLASAGFDVAGADLSVPLLSRAVAAARHDRRAGDSVPVYAAADIRSLPFANGAFDGAIDVFTSLGLFADPRDDLRALREIARVLRPAAPRGRFLLETMHRDDVVANYAPRDEWTLPDGTSVRVRRRFDPWCGLSHEVLRWRHGQSAGTKRHTIRLRSATDVARLLDAAGFRILDAWGDWTGEPFRHDSPRLIVLTERAD